LKGTAGIANESRVSIISLVKSGKCTLILTAVILVIHNACIAAERTQNFDRDPGWHEHNNRGKSPEPRQIRQDFGYSKTAHCGGSVPGEIGGFIQPAAEAAYYAKVIPTKTFNDPLSASGKVVCEGRQFHVLVGFFNAKSTNEWRTPNGIVLRLQGRGDHFFAYLEYTTSKWRSGGDSPGGFSQVGDPKSGRLNLKGFPNGTNIHQWSLRYDPNGNNGGGSITATLDNETSICHLDKGHKADSATFNRCGVINVMKQYDDGGEVWLDDISVNGETESFDRDPKWEALQNRRTYVTTIVRPRFDFGYSDTRHAGGKKGEMGGLIFRGDGRYTNKMAFYGDRLDALTLEKPLKASGKVALRRAVTDSDILFGFFHAEHSLDSGGSDAIGTPPDFLGVSIGGPSREGFMFSPSYRLHNTERDTASRGPYLHPNGAPHQFTLEYAPASATAQASITVTLDGERATLPLPRGQQAVGAHFNRFGLISTHTDGNGQHLYFDDLTYTWTQEEKRAAQRTLRGHTGSVMSVAFSHDGKVLASSSRDETIRLWDPQMGEMKQKLTGHTGDVYSVAFAPGDKTLVSGAGDHRIFVWDLRTGKIAQTLEGHTDVVRSVAFSPDGKLLASTGADLTVRLWDTSIWQAKTALTGHTARIKSVAFSHDGRFVASAGDDRTVRLWEAPCGTLKAQWTAHTRPIECVAYSPTGRFLATGSNDESVRLWNSEGWKLERTFEGHHGEVDSIAFSPDGRLLASGSKDHALRLWDVRSNVVRALPDAHDDRIESLAFSPDGQTLATGSGGKDGTIKLWVVPEL